MAAGGARGSFQQDCVSLGNFFIVVLICADRLIPLQICRIPQLQVFFSYHGAWEVYQRLSSLSRAVWKGEMVVSLSENGVLIRHER